MSTPFGFGRLVSLFSSRRVWTSAALLAVGSPTTMAIQSGATASRQVPAKSTRQAARAVLQDVRDLARSLSVLALELDHAAASRVALSVSTVADGELRTNELLPSLGWESAAKKATEAMACLHALGAEITGEGQALEQGYAQFQRKTLFWFGPATPFCYLDLRSVDAWMEDNAVRVRVSASVLGGPRVGFVFSDAANPSFLLPGGTIESMSWDSLVVTIEGRFSRRPPSVYPNGSVVQFDLVVVATPFSGFRAQLALARGEFQRFPIHAVVRE